jgi:uncharacterized membrane protein
MTVWVIAVGRMLGLGTSAGLRPSLTLAVIGIMSNIGWGADVNGAFSFLHHWLTIIILIVLALLESSFDKIIKVDRLQDRLIAPYRLAGGAVAGAATIPFGWKGIVIGAALGMFAASLAQCTKHVTRPRSVPSDVVVTLLSLAEDLGAFLGSSLTLAVPYFGFVPPAAATAILLRTSRRRRAKYRRLRRQAAAGRMERRMPLHAVAPAESTFTVGAPTSRDRSAENDGRWPLGTGEDLPDEPVGLTPGAGDEDDD